MPPERLLGAPLSQLFYPIRSERLLVEQLAGKPLFRWFVGLVMDEVWHHGVASERRQRPPDEGMAKGVLRTGARAEQTLRVGRALQRARYRDRGLGRRKSLRRKGDAEGDESDFRGERRTDQTNQPAAESEARLYRSPGWRQSRHTRSAKGPSGSCIRSYEAFSAP